MAFPLSFNLGVVDLSCPGGATLRTSDALPGQLIVVTCRFIRTTLPGQICSVQSQGIFVSLSTVIRLAAMMEILERSSRPSDQTYVVTISFKNSV